MGIEKNAYMKLEQRGEIPEKHLCSLSRVLKVSTTDLLVEKYAPVMRHIFHIPTEIFRTFVKDHMSEDRAFGKKFPTLEKLSVGVLTSDHV
ncbi:MAG: hypothetical protein A2928_03520 [Candidatus Taylorbacteria bacterium RIFCSPLOWO2_01_FULL_45_15b]|uniref:Uncharacterized protein n=1 Tax=Candidatus Taylorbacteria bacterium RIFCSPLOWO2_01_FULL_45_15b TaxID=1802319 RepID=A0A1G2NB95_9BACT|nr:MAG: hypothetical protein A2928_03520 [Candidatus Taylorbacteria bacterium RIFCSPLOWO2_01_FULL_45_15b]